MNLYEINEGESAEILSVDIDKRLVFSKISDLGIKKGEVVTLERKNNGVALIGLYGRLMCFNESILSKIIVKKISK